MKTELESYLLQALNMALQIAGETSYTNSFDVQVSKEGFYFIPRLPASYVIDDELYQKIYRICNTALYPDYTLLKQVGTYLVPIETKDLRMKRALYYPWLRGIPKRLVIKDINQFVASLNEDEIPVMENCVINYAHVNHIGIAGTSGGGKSYFVTYLLYMLQRLSEIVVVDPKFDSPSRWCRTHNVPVIAPKENESKSDFVSSVNNVLSSCLSLIHQRQYILYENPKTLFRHHTIVIDELLALSEGVAKPIKESFFSLLIQVALLGRSTRCHLVLISQRFDNTALPLSCKEQMNVLIQVGNINSKTTQFLFPDLELNGIVIPQGVGTGLIQIIDAEHPFQIVPLLTPTFD